jgi:hypothetical protein
VAEFDTPELAAMEFNHFSRECFRTEGIMKRRVFISCIASSAVAAASGCASMFGVPPKSETKLLPGRQIVMRNRGGNATMTVFPVRIGVDANHTAGSGGIVDGINKAGLLRAVAAQNPLPFSSRLSSNELRWLWDLARDFREYVRNNPVDSEYALCANYGFNPGNWKQGFVHFVVCDKAGEWVIVDMQNSHGADYTTVRPTSKEECDTLLLKRLGKYFREK